MIVLPTFKEESQLWNQGYDLVIGVDEVGRGCFAGPVVASAVAFSAPRGPVGLFPHPMSSVESSLRALDGVPPRVSPATVIPRIDDSKRLKPLQREKAAEWIKENCLSYGIGEVDVVTINKIGIGKASAIAMRKAVTKILDAKKLTTSGSQYPNIFLLIDAFYIPYLKGITKMRQKPIVKGDQKSFSIAAASIVAKVYRDLLMQRLAKKYHAYGWARNKGYGTRDHRQAILKNGITNLHRTAFVQTFLSSSNNI